MWIIVVFIMVLGAGSMTFRAATDPHRNEPVAPAEATNGLSLRECVHWRSGIMVVAKPSAPCLISARGP